MKKIYLSIALLLTASITLSAQNGLTDMTRSRHAITSSVKMGDTKWQGGFWGERFEVFSDTMIISMFRTLDNPATSHAYRNIQIAAGVCKGDHVEPPFNDGDFFKWLEAVATVYGVTREPRLDAMMDSIIVNISKAQREDGYLHTPVIIAEMNKGVDSHKKSNITVGTAVGTADEGAFNNRLNFETYNLGHLMMAGIVHHRATGKRTLLDVAVKATDFLCEFYRTATATLARNAICPSHYMGVVEMWRTTGDPKYLELAQNLLNIRGMVGEIGTDDNQDRVPFRAQTKAMGHSVRANYLYAGVADLYAETGEQKLRENLESIWEDIVTRKMYITGGCGALYDGTSPDGTCYVPDSIQKVHQSYGRAYQLPNQTAHNETCANIGNMLFNWRMFEVSGDKRYIDVLETTLYNSVMSGVSLDGKRFFYTNPLRESEAFPYTLRWGRERQEHISCYCCPPNTVRTLCQAQEYAYSVGKGALWVNLYGGNTLTTSIPEVGEVSLVQTTNYPWSGDVEFEIKQAPKKSFKMLLRIPDHSGKGSCIASSKNLKVSEQCGYYVIEGVWKKGDKVSLKLDMTPQIVEAHPLVEEVRGQVAVKMGPVVYCLEAMDIADGTPIDNISIPVDTKFAPEMTTIDGYPVMRLVGEVEAIDQSSWEGVLYRPVERNRRKVKVSLVPYYAWGNRGKADMTVWIPSN